MTIQRPHDFSGSLRSHDLPQELARPDYHVEIGLSHMGLEYLNCRHWAVEDALAAGLVAPARWVVAPGLLLTVPQRGDLVLC